MRRLFADDEGRIDSNDGTPSANAVGPATIGFASRLVLAVGVGALAYLAVERLRSLASTPDVSMDAGEKVRDRVGTAVPIDLEELPVGGSVAERAEHVLGSPSDAVDADDADRMLRERSMPNVQEEPAEPGEMTVDEDIVDDVVDEE